MKRLISVLLLIALIFSYFPAIPLEAKAATDGDYTYSISNGEATITGYNGAGGDITIPDTLGGYLVTAIDAYAFNDCANLTSVTIPDSVTTIGEWAFNACNGLTAVTIPYGVTTIERYAFHWCESLTSVTIPDSVLTIGEAAFNGCDALATVTIGNSVTTIGGSAFSGCPSLTSLTIPDSVTAIGESAFSNCTSLTSVTIPNGVTAISNYLFYYCPNLTSVTLPATLVSVGRDAFGECSKLTDVYFNGPENLWKAVSIDTGNACLQNATVHWEKTDFTYDVENGKATITGYNGAGGDVIIPDTLGGCSVTAIGDEAFWGCTSMTSVKIPDTVITIGDYAFCYCTKLTSVTIPDSVKTIGEYAFAGYLDEETGDFASSLTSVTIGSGVTTIGADAFSACGKLTSVTIPDNVTRIDYGAFCFCYNLTSVTIGKGVTAIPDSAFRACENLTTVTIPASVTTVGESAFEHCTKLTDVYYDGTQSQWDSITVHNYGNKPLQNATVHFPEPEVPEATDYTYTVENGEATITGYTGAGGDVIIPSTLGGYPVTAIGKNAFQTCEKLETVVIPDGVKTLGTYAFWDCSNLRSVTIGKGVTSFGERAFGNCKILNRVIISEGVTSIGTAAFEFCTGLEVISIPEGVTEIGERAFRLTDLKKISLPETVKTIGLSAFENCSELATVYYAGTQEQWNEISVGESNGCLLSAMMEFGKTSETPLVPEYTYKVENGEATIIEYNGPGGEIVVPMVFGGYPVTGIGQEVFADCDNLTAVTINYGITNIGKKAFYDCDGLTSLWISDTVITIGEAAFSGCDNLKTITVPNSVETMEGYAFASCTGLKTVEISSSITQIGEHLFDGCTGLTSVMIPDGVTTIGDGGFYQCAGLTTVTIPGSVTTIGASAFAGCDAMTNVFYKGTSEQWQEVTVGSGNERLQNAEIRYTMDPADPGDADFTYRLENGEATITGYTGAGGDITIPSALGGCPVTTIDYYAFEQNNDLTSVVIPGTVKTIGFGAFRYCPNLASVTLGDGIVDMGVQTFRSCTSLKSFVIPDSVTEISAEVFYECTGLEEVTIGSGVTAIGDSAFRFCDSLKTVELPAALQSIGHLAFYSCDNLSAYYVHEDNVFFASEQGVLFNKDKTELVLAPMAMTGAYVVPETVKKIGDMAFHSCSGLTSIDLGSNVTTIGETAFSGCGGLTSLIIPDSVTQLGYQAFYGCSGLTSVTIGTGITEIPESVFYLCTGLETLTIPDHITVIGCSAFDSCHGLTEVTLPAGLTLVKEGAFDYCNNLTNVYYKGTRRQWEFMTIQEKNDILFSAYVHCGDEQETPDAKDFVYEIKNGEATIIGYKGAGGDIEISPIWAGYPVTAIAKDAFYWNSLITGVTIPGSVKRIDDNAFFNCVNMVTLTLVEGVQEIGSSAFFACDKLTSVVIPDSVTKIESEAFCLCGSLQSVTLGKGVQTIESGAFAQCEKLVSIQVDPNNVFFRDVNGVLFSGTTLVQYPGGRSGSYTVPAGTTAIGSSAFCWTDHLTEVTLPDSVKTIGSNAFWYSGIKKIQLGKNLETIGYGAFELSNLTEIHIPDSVTTIEGAAFKECYALKTVRIGLGVKTIGCEAFCWCYPETVYYAGTRAQWDTIEIAGYNDDLLNANIVYEGDHTHSYVAKVTKPTCTAKGYTTYTCSCGDTYKSNYINALGHSYKSGSCTRCKYKPAGAKITTQPKNVAVSSGKTATVTIKASGTGLKYTWYYAKKGAKSYTKASSTTNSYSLKMSSSYDGTKVYCVVSDAYGNSVKSAVVTLYKGTPAKITTQPKSTTVANGKSGSITLKASGSSLKYQWYIKYKGASSFTKVGKSSKTYSFKMASKLDGAQVYCVVKDKYGIEVKSSTVTIKQAPLPKITTQPKSTKAFSGKTVKFTVKASGEGLKYQWYYAKKGSSSFKKLSAKSATYSVKVSSSVDGRKYYCLVTDKYGQTVKTSTVTLTMQRAAKILAQPKNVSVKNGKTAKVTIKAEGDGLKYTWYYLLAGETKYRKATFTGNAFSVTMSAKYKNAKVYCAISDQYGNTVKSKTVTLKMK